MNCYPTEVQLLKIRPWQWQECRRDGKDNQKKYLFFIDSLKR
ncbi:hypothetical protein yberc0001_26050 [Yersinia bercovieri ATCC 43970]|uniref:Transposase n=1 Tax=Yersinia bercovieri ATCC 43970 TaxID=349968 RepID=A0ABM9XYW4_YERBE|nr:hypothetical protein yberc0001_26050 [Yersinia bercovieri ATCC 43970]